LTTLLSGEIYEIAIRLNLTDLGNRAVCMAGKWWPS